MSYWCQISFKEIKAEDIQEFFLNLKKKARERFEQAVEDSYIYSPMHKDVFYKNSIYIQLCKKAAILQNRLDMHKAFSVAYILYFRNHSAELRFTIWQRNNLENLMSQSLQLINCTKETGLSFLGGKVENQNEYIRVI